jgi:dUTP pyrophosphatase
VIAPRAHALLRTGLGIGVPDDHVFHVYARSSLFPKYGLIVANGVGVIDPDYSGPDDEVLISVWNPGDREVRIAAGTRVAQGIIFPRPRIRWIEADAAGTTRGGFGSTGR